MKKTLAESIRSTLEILSEGNLDYALSDLHKESNGEPSQELADEIAAEYGLKGSQLLAAYPKYAETQHNKTPSEPVSDPAKAKQKADYDSRTRSNQYMSDLETKKAAEKEQIAAKRTDHSDEHAALEAEIDSLVAPEGWTKDVSEPEYKGWNYGHVATFTNPEGNVKIKLQGTISDKEYANKPGFDEGIAYNGDTTFEVGGKWFTFTDYSKHGDSFSIGKYSGNTIADLPAILAKEEARAKASIEKKSARG